MNRNSSHNDDSWESDAVWNLLEQASSKTASPSFANNVVRAARLAADIKPWWKKLLSPAPMAGFAAATAAVAIAFVSLADLSTNSGSPVAVLNSPEAVAIQDIAETETLIAAVDQLDDFSDTELVSLIGF